MPTRRVATYKAHDFDRMIEKQKPDAVIVTSMDRTHHTYIIRAMELGCDVITEKPMTVDEGKCQDILDAVERTGRKCGSRSTTAMRRIIRKPRELIMQRRDRPSDFGSFRMAAEHDARGRLFPPMAPGQAQQRRTARA